MYFCRKLEVQTKQISADVINYLKRREMVRKKEEKRGNRNNMKMCTYRLVTTNIPHSVPQNRFTIRGLGHKYMNHFLLIK
jgi:hypothetical protein